MNPFDINPQKIAEEVLEFNSKLARGFETLAKFNEPSTGVSAKDPVYKEDKLVLYHYQARRKKQNPIPVLIVYALVNRPYMADLQEDRSLIRGALDAGLDVYLIDWGYPDAADRYLSLDDYINGYIDRCVDVIRERSGQDRINLLGICQGGTFSLCYTSLHQDKVKNLITTVTPVDFHTENDLLSHLARNVDVDASVEALGNIPGQLLNWSFMMLKPFRLMGQKYIDLVDILDDEKKVKNFMNMEKWIFDSPDQAGLAYSEFIKLFYQQNKLVKSELSIAGRLVNLQDITVPVLNIFARDDHLVPPDSSRALAGCIGSEDYSELEFPGGHIGIYVSARAQQTLPRAIAEWLAERSS
jgi:polyhydroxyalkanoate synthase subunit PhaC